MLPFRDISQRECCFQNSRRCTVLWTWMGSGKKWWFLSWFIPTNHRPCKGTWAKDGILDFKDLGNKYIGIYPKFWSDEASAPWLYNPDTGLMISYDDAQSISSKASYVNVNSLAGMDDLAIECWRWQFHVLNALIIVLNSSQSQWLAFASLEELRSICWPCR